MKIKTVIKKYSNQFESKTRDNGERYIILKDGASEKLQNAVYEAHGELMPNDWIFSTFSSILSGLEGYEVECLEDIETYRHEIVDSLVDVYTSGLTSQLNSSVYFISYIDEAVKEYGATENVLMVAQYMAIDEVFSEVINLLEDSI